MMVSQINFLIFLLAICISQLSAQIYDYTWMKGSPTKSLAVHGTLGLSSVSITPGHKGDGISWTDQAGDLWLYGGQGVANGTYGFSSDLWKYSLQTNNWTWISGTAQATQNPVYGTLGVPSSSNTPGGRYGSAAWTDLSGNIWLFGGRSTSGLRNDLWRYNILSGMWTWMGGANTPSQTAIYGTLGIPSANNIPGASVMFTSWRDNAGNFWMYDAMDGNEIWKYNPITLQWAWMSGTSTGTVLPVYGTLGSFASTSHPGERMTKGVSDAAGNLFVFGGETKGITSNGWANDLWKYDITINQWAWVGGSSITNQSGNYGTQGTFSPSNVPGGRAGHVLWYDLTGRLWLFGGGNGNNYPDLFNDTWCYEISTGEWAWMNGGNFTYQFSSTNSGAVYGSQGIPAASNTPGYRLSPVYWVEDLNTLWIFSGYGQTYSDELWRFNSCRTTPVVSSNSSSLSLCAGSNATLAANGTAASYSWNTGAQSPSISVAPLATTVYSVAMFKNNCKSISIYSLNVIQPPNLNVSSSANPVCSGRMAVITATGAATYTWNTGFSSSSFNFLAPSTTTTFTITGSNSGCNSTATFTQYVLPLPVLIISGTGDEICTGETSSITVTGASIYSWSPQGLANSTITVKPLQTTSYSVTGTDANGCQSSATYEIQVFDCVSVREIKDENHFFSIFPNPATEEFTVERALGKTLRIFNAMGQTVLQQRMESDRYIISKHLSAGIYYCQLYGSTETVKLVIE